jgi:acyl carrier protein
MNESVIVSSLEERVHSIIAEQLRIPIEKVVPEAHLADDLRADSLDIVDLTIAIEEAFEIDGSPLEISEDEAAELATVHDVMQFLLSKGAQ